MSQLPERLAYRLRFFAGNQNFHTLNLLLNHAILASHHLQ